MLYKTHASIYGIILFFTCPLFAISQNSGDTIRKKDLINIVGNLFRKNSNEVTEKKAKKIYFSFLPVSAEAPEPASRWSHPQLQDFISVNEKHFVVDDYIFTLHHF